MNNKLVISLLAIMAFCGCQKETIQNEITTTGDGASFTAVIEDEFSNTKTSVDNEGNILWKKGDQMSIFAGSTNNDKYQVTDASDGKTTAELTPISSSGFVAGNEIDNNVAFYPYQSTATIVKQGAEYVIQNIELPSLQDYAESSFGNGTFPMAAVTASTADRNLVFKNVLGALKLQLTGTASIVSVQVTGNNNEILCGKASVTASNVNAPSISLTEESAKSVTLDCGAGVQLNSTTPTSFVIALPPMVMSGGFTVLVKDTDGAQMEIKTTKSQTIARSSILKMPAVDYVGTKKPLTFTSTGSTTIALCNENSPYTVTIEYKLNDSEWTSYAIGDVISLNDKEQVSFRAGAGGNAHFSNNQGFYHFDISGSGTVAASGNIMSLVNQNMNSLTIPDEYYFYFLFVSCALLTTAPELPALTLTESCYGFMFIACSALSKVPTELPATTLAKNCYSGMFSGCSALTTTPDLPATTLADSCYDNMFSSCSALTKAPDLSAPILKKGCYSGMFDGCTSLTKAPDLPAITLVEECYSHMFSGCTNLNYVKALFTSTPSDTFTLGWLWGVSSSGTFIKSKDATWNVTGPNGVPTGWIVQTE